MSRRARLAAQKDSARRVHQQIRSRPRANHPPVLVQRERERRKRAAVHDSDGSRLPPAPIFALHPRSLRDTFCRLRNPYKQTQRDRGAHDERSFRRFAKLSQFRSSLNNTTQAAPNSARQRRARGGETRCRSVPRRATLKARMLVRSTRATSRPKTQTRLLRDAQHAPARTTPRRHRRGARRITRDAALRPRVGGRSRSSLQTLAADGTVPAHRARDRVPTSRHLPARRGGGRPRYVVSALHAMCGSPTDASESAGREGRR